MIAAPGNAKPNIYNSSFAAPGAGVVEAQPFYMQQSWGLDLDAKQTAEKILTAARQ